MENVAKGADRNRSRMEIYAMYSGVVQRKEENGDVAAAAAAAAAFGQFMIIILLVSNNRGPFTLTSPLLHVALPGLVAAARITDCGNLHFRKVSQVSIPQTARVFRPRNCTRSISEMGETTRKESPR
jgi:hypothetical protein